MQKTEKPFLFIRLNLTIGNDVTLLGYSVYYRLTVYVVVAYDNSLTFCMRRFNAFYVCLLSYRVVYVTFATTATHPFYF